MSTPGEPDSSVSLSLVGVSLVANGRETDGSPVVFRFIRSDSIATPLSEPLTIRYSLFGTARAGIDFLGAGEGTLTFAADSTTLELRLPVPADAEIDPGETVILRLSPSPAYAIEPGAQFATATITAEGVSTQPTSDGRFDNPSQAEWRNGYAFTALRSDGSTLSWGLAPFGGDSSGVDVDGPNDDLSIRQVFSNGFAFAALRDDGSVLTWGAGPLGGDSSGVDFNGPGNDLAVVSIASSERAFAALRSDGSVVSWGNIGVGGNSAGVDFDGPSNDLRVQALFANRAALAALRSDGSVVSWGNPNDGGNSSGIAFTGANGSLTVTRIFASERAFAALRSDGSVLTWGNGNYGGSSSGVAINGASGDLAVVTIAATDRAFAALRADGSVVSWGDGLYGGDSSGVGVNAADSSRPVSALVANRHAFAALRVDGSVVVWGNSRFGGTLGSLRLDAPSAAQAVVQIAATDTAFAALHADGSVSSWGLASDGGNSSGIDFNGPTDDLRVLQIVANRFAFAALRSDGSVLTWGSAGLGGSSAGVAFKGPNGSLRVTQIVPTEGAFAALRSDGSVVSWGSSTNGGDSSGIDFNGSNNDLKVVGFANPATNDHFTPLPPNQPPEAVTLIDPLAALAENTPTSEPIRLAQVQILDDGQGRNSIRLLGPDAGVFALNGLELVLQASVELDFERQSSYDVTVEVADVDLPDAEPVRVDYRLALLNLDDGPGELDLISGQAIEGAPLTTGEVRNDPDGLAPDPQLQYRWFRNAEELDGATGTSFTPSSTGAGEYTVEVTYTDGAGSRSSLRSAPLTVSASNNGHAAFLVSGDLRVGGSAQLVRTAGDPDGPGNEAEPAVAWETSADGLGWELLSNANGPTIVIGAEAAGRQLRARATYGDGQGFATEVVTAAVAIAGLSPVPPDPAPSHNPGPILWPPPLNPGHPGHQGISRGRGPKARSFIGKPIPKGLQGKANPKGLASRWMALPAPLQVLPWDHHDSSNPLAIPGCDQYLGLG